MAPEQETSASTARILVVDDEESVRLMIGKRLTHAGYQVAEATDATEALAILDSQPIDLVALDIMMPNVSGLEMLAEIRRLHPPTALPVIMLTADITTETVVEALRRGANDYITKPIDFELLFKRMRVHLAIKSGKGQLIGPYRIVEKLGAGAMGTVFSAVDINAGDKLAIKVLPRSLTIDDEFVLRFLREARLASQLRHPNLVRCLGASRSDETFFMTMELASGRNLRSIIDEGRLPVERALDIISQVAGGLGAVHDAGFIHRDVKPENIIVADDGLTRLTDFGIAREGVSDMRVTETGRWVGSLAYSSPEQMVGKGDNRSDIYSLGCTLFAMLAGDDPFAEYADFESVLKTKKKKPPDVRDFNAMVPEKVSRLTAKLMAAKPRKRFKSCKAVVEAVGITARKIAAS